MPTKRERVFAGIERYARDAINAATEKRNNCVAATRVIVDVCHYYGIVAGPMMTKLRVVNKTMFERMADWQKWNPGRKTPGLVQKDWAEQGAWSVEIGYGVDPTHPLYEPDGLNGHLVALTADGMVLDGSLEQVNRPEKKIGPMPGVLILQDDDPSDPGCGWIAPCGSYVVYTFLPKRTDYLGSGDWSEPLRYAPAVAEIINRIGDL